MHVSDRAIPVPRTSRDYFSTQPRNMFRTRQCGSPDVPVPLKLTDIFAWEENLS